jgi:hypothetical protein
MQRPPFEIRRMEDEQRRRERAHRALRWERRRRTLARAATVLAPLLLALLGAYLLGVFPGWW